MGINNIFRSDQPILWVVPAFMFSIISVLSILNAIIQFIPKSISGFMMLMASAMISSTVAGYITELTRGRKKIVYYTMVVTLVGGGILFTLGQEFLKQNVASGIQVSSIPFIGELLSTLTVTLIPGIFSGSVIGGVASLIPLIPEGVMEVATPKQVDIPIQVEVPKITPDKWPGYVKACSKCEQIMPSDSIFCSNCGSTLRKIKATNVRFCRYCGHRIYFIGEFCPDCGREINLISKPKVYVSQ